MSVQRADHTGLPDALDDHAIAIRRAGTADVDLLADLRVAMRRDIGDLAAPDEAAVAEANRCYLREKLPSDELVALVAEAEGRIVGTGWLVLFRKPPSSGNMSGVEGYVLNMYTEPAWRGRGIARRLVEEMLAIAREAGAPLVWLRATEAGRRVYEKLGFAENPRYLQVKL